MIELDNVDKAKEKEFEETTFKERDELDDERFGDNYSEMQD